MRAWVSRSVARDATCCPGVCVRAGPFLYTLVVQSLGVSYLMGSSVGFLGCSLVGFCLTLGAWGVMAGVYSCVVGPRVGRGLRLLDAEGRRELGARGLGRRGGVVCFLGLMVEVVGLL
jgi:hypothetical protein